MASMASFQKININLVVILAGKLVLAYALEQQGARAISIINRRGFAGGGFSPSSAAREGAGLLT